MGQGGGVRVRTRAKPNIILLSLLSSLTCNPPPLALYPYTEYLLTTESPNSKASQSFTKRYLLAPNANIPYCQRPSSGNTHEAVVVSSKPRPAPYTCFVCWWATLWQDLSVNSPVPRPTSLGQSKQHTPMPQRSTAIPSSTHPFWPSQPFLHRGVSHPLHHRTVKICIEARALLAQAYPPPRDHKQSLALLAWSNHRLAWRVWHSLHLDGPGAWQHPEARQWDP